MTDRYDLAVIGGGTAGLVAAAGGALLGARVILFEREALGGDCLWTGCVPSKTLIRSARVRHLQRDGGRFGVGAASTPLDYGAVANRMREVQRAIEPHDSPERFRDLGVDVVLEPARLDGRDRIVSNSRTVAARRVLIATGSRSVAPPIPGLEQTGYLTHVSALALERLPRTVIVLGGGPIGLEFAQLYRRLGVEVTVIERERRILQGEDADAADVVRACLEREGVLVHTGLDVTRVEPGQGGVTRVLVGEHDFEAEALLVATGRRANIEGLGLESAGVAVTERGIAVDAGMRTSARGVFAAGDVTGKYLFTHVADYQARLVVANALVPLVRRRADYRAVPWVTYTDPELARVGATEVEARERHGDGVQVWRYDLADSDRALIDGETDGFVKLIADRRGRLLGAHIVGADAGNLIAAPALAVSRGLKLADIAATVLPYPTFPEAIKRAAELRDRERLASAGGRLLRRLVRWRGA
ncbi:MAG: dihydrolipoyl dehydrogenase family protein [Longimicrobiales bacterium]